MSSDCFAILRNLLEKHTLFPAKRPADAKEILGLQNLLKKHALFPGKRPADAMETIDQRNLLKKHTLFPVGRPADAVDMEKFLHLFFLLKILGAFTRYICEGS